MKFEEFESLYKSIEKRTSTWAIFSAVVFAILFAIWTLVFFEAIPAKSIFTMGVMILIVVLAMIMGRSSGSRAWNRSGIRCHRCQVPFNTAIARHAYQQRTCRQCGEYPFEPSIDAEQAFTAVDLTTIKKPNSHHDMATAPLKRSINDTSSEPTDEVNPYASPGDAGTAKPQVSGALELAKMWLKSIADSSETLLSSRQQIIDRVNEQSRAMGGESLMSGKEKHVVSQTRRKAAWFLICSVLLPAIGATFVVSQLDGSWWITLLIGLLALVGFLLGGGILYLTTVYAGPRWLRRWFRGNPPPIRPQHDEDSAFFGIRMPVPPQAGESARPILRFEYRMNAAADLEVCLVDTVNATQFERPITCRTPGQWTRIEVNFDLLLKEAGSSFCGDEVRLIPPQDAELEIDDLVVFYPLQTNDGDAGTTV